MTAIDEKEIERLRELQEDGGLSDGQVFGLLREIRRLNGEVASMTNEMLDCRASWAIACESLAKAERERDEARSQAAAQQAVIDRDLVVTPHAETCICPRCRLTVESGRDILDALAKAEAALKYFAEAPFEELPPRWQAARDALAAIQALGISKQRT